MLTLRIRKLVLLALIALIVIMGNLMAIAAWLSQTGAIDVAQHIRKEYLTGTAITILIALLFLLVGPARSRAAGANCPVCDHPQHSGHYCKQCGSARA
ncbi:MAG: hypothetical protein ACE37H_04935 [Phycisphaeraceae bacterium]